MITFDHISFSRGSRIILNDISFSIAFTERVAILGASGEGKTTILRLMTRLLKPDKGTISVDATDITDMKERDLQLIRKKFGLVFQDGALFDSLTVRENVAFNLREFTMMTEQQIQHRVKTLLEYVGVSEAIDLMPEELSGGMQRRVALARTLASEEPRMFLYDEPTSDLDPVNAMRIRKLILDVNGAKRGFIIVTHEMHDALKLANRFLFIKQGKILFDGDSTALFKSTIQDLQIFLEDVRGDYR